MTETLTRLHAKVDKLIKQYKASLAENERLRAVIEGQNKVIQSLNAKAGTVAPQPEDANGEDKKISQKEKRALKKQIDTLIADVNQLIEQIEG